MKLFTINEAVDMLGVAYHRVWYAIATGKVKPHYRSGRSILFDAGNVKQLRRLFAGRRVDA